MFAGRVEYESSFDSDLQEAAKQLVRSSLEMLDYGQRCQGRCDPLEGQIKLQDAICELSRLLRGWVTPKLAVSPAPRRWSMSNSDDDTEEIRRTIESLPPLPEDWQPDDPEQQVLYRELRES